MKHIYLNSRLTPLLLSCSRLEPRTWVFSLGEPWLYLSPPRLARLAARLGLEDVRIGRLVDLVRRHSPFPQSYCGPLGIAADPHLTPKEYPIAVCPECDGVHNPHPLDADQPCSECRERRRRSEERAPSPLMLRDRRLDRRARSRVREKDPSLFDGDRLSPNWRINHSRRLQRDWDSAVNRIFMGAAYRRVARDFDCSVGLLHRKVCEERERMYWEDN